MVGYAVVQVGGKQHRVSVGEKILVDLQADRKVGDTFKITDVMMLGGESYTIGYPFVSNAGVNCLVTCMGKDEEGVKGEKVRVYKKKRRKGFTKTIGHRQRYTEISIESIDA